jgi:glycosyltransferase involved in cell wall biosynthesis
VSDKPRTTNEIGIIALVPDQWGPQWQPRHHVMSRLASYFQVVWMNCPPGWRRCLRPRTIGSTDHPKALQVYQPEFWLPLLSRPARLAQFTSRERIKRASNLLRARGCKKLVLYVWRPDFLGALNEPRNLSIYHVDDEYSFSPTEVEISAAERKLLTSVDQVFIHSPALMEKKGLFNPNTEFIPNGVNYAAFSTPVPEPDDLRGIPHPRIGYMGWIKRMLNFDLLLQLMSAHPRWSFVFVGPQRPHPEMAEALRQMSGRQNAYFLGGKSTECLGAYPQHFDVCTMPYRMDDYTKYIYPLKLHEYLASGQPVVSTPIRSVEEFGQVVTLATNLQEWSRAIVRALSPEENNDTRRAERQRFAREHDWETLVGRIANTISTRLGVASPPNSAEYTLPLSF